METDEGQDPYASCLSLAHLMRAADVCYRGVRWKRQAQLFMSHKLTECRRLQRELLDGTYKPTRTESFDIVERGKPRTIRPVDFRDRVVQRCLCDNALLPAIERHVVPDCSACLRGRGVDYAIGRIREYAERCPQDGWVLQSDFHDYFHSIDSATLARLVHELLPDDGLAALAMMTITTGESGLELGSHVSQLIACAYATPVDHAVMGIPGVIGYHRYMDDGIAFCADRGSAIAARETLCESTEGLGLTLNERKTHVNRVTTPFSFCKMRISKQPDGTVRVNVRKPQSRRAVRHARGVVRLSRRNPDVDPGPCLASLSGYLGRGDADPAHLVGRALVA